MNISDLRRQHDEICATARQLTQLIDTQTDPRGVGALRWRLARQLTAHLALEDRIFYPALQRSTDARVREPATALRLEMGALSDRFNTYMAQWSDDRVAREWPGFCAETRQILKILQDRVDREELMLYPIAESIGQDQAASRWATN